MSEAIRPANDAVIYKTRVASRFVFGWLFILSKYTQFWELPAASAATPALATRQSHIFCQELLFCVSMNLQRKGCILCDDAD